MIINFSQHRESEISFAHRYEPAEIDLDDETAQIVGQIEVMGNARRSSEIARLRGDLRGNLEVACSRCLQPIQFELNAPFEIDFVTLENYGSVNDETELNYADLSLSVYDGEEINLDEIVREQVLLALPMQRLCQEHCAGLCPTCSINKNIGSCDCSRTGIDPRWNALKQLKSR